MEKYPKPFAPFEIKGLPDLQGLVIEGMKKYDLFEKPGITSLKRECPDFYSQLVASKTIQDLLKPHPWGQSLFDLTINVIGPEGVYDIHMDAHPDHVAPYRILVPIANCEATQTRFYSSDQEPEVLQYTTSTGEQRPYFLYRPEHCTEIYCLELTEPHVVDVSKPHGVTNPKPHYRTNLWIDFGTDFSAFAQRQLQPN